MGKKWLTKALIVVNCILLICIGYFSINNFKHGVWFSVNYAKTYHSVPNFYYDNGDGFSERYMIFPSKYEGKKAQFFIPFDIINDIKSLRYDYAQTNGEIEIVSLSIDGGKIYSQNSLQNNIYIFSNVNQIYENDKCNIVIDGVNDDPSILFSEDLIRDFNRSVNYNWKSLLPIIALVILSGIMWIYIIRHKNLISMLENLICFYASKLSININRLIYGENNNKNFKILVFILSFGCILVLNFSIVSRYDLLDNRSYSVEQNSQFIETNEYKSKINIYANNTNSIIFSIKCNEIPSGYFSCIIFDRNNDIVCEYINEKLSDYISYNDGMDCYSLEIDVSNCYLVANQDYQVYLVFDEKNSISILLQDSKEYWTKQTYTNDISYIITTVMIIADIVFIILLILLLKYGLTDNNFLIISLVIGCFFAIFITPASQDDEYRHFIRAYDITQGNFSSQLKNDDGITKGVVIAENNGNIFYANVPNDLNEIRLLDDDFNYDNRSYSAELNLDSSIDRFISLIQMKENKDTYEVAQTGVGYLGILSYFPQSFMILCGKILGVRPLYYIYLARFGNLLICTLIAFLCLKLVPQYKAGIWVLHFMPGISVLRSSSSTDGLLFASVLLLGCYIFYIKNSKKMVCKASIITIMLLLSTHIAIIKLLYMLIIAGLIILGEDNYSNKKNIYIKNVVLIIGIFICTLILYSLYVRFLSPTSNNNISSPIICETQLKFLKTNTFDAIKMMIAGWMRICGQSGLLFGAVKGRVLDFGYGYVYIVLLIITLYMLPRTNNYIERSLMLLLFAFIWLVIVFAFYGICGNVITLEIEGMSERYVNQILPVFLFVLPSSKEEKKSMFANKLQYLTIVIAMLHSFELLNTYWIH